MDISPQRVRTAEFKTVKKGLDPDEVRSFLDEVAAELERAQNQSTAMEARARAAVARLQEISEATPSAPPDESPATTAVPAVDVAPAAEPVAEVSPSVDQAETISRTLLLAQRTADTAIAEAEAEAARLKQTAEDEATRTLDSTREMSERLIDEAREEARRTGEAERIQVESEVNALLARRDFLESDVDHLQSFIVDERSRLRDAATSILDLVERVPGGLGEVRRPLLSASDDLEQGDDASHAATEEVAVADVAVAGERPVDEDVSMEESDDVGSAEIWGEGGDSIDTEPTLDAAAAPAASDEPDQLVIQTDISDEGPTGFSYDDQNR